MPIQGWYRDPYRTHGLRWVSGGRPTSLVRDGELESHDPPGEVEPSIPVDEWEPVPDPLDPWHQAPAEPSGEPGRDRPTPVRALILFLAVFLAVFLLFGLYVIVWMGGSR